MNLSRTGQVATLVLMAILSIGLLVFTLPRLQASLRFLPVDTAINNYYETRQIPLLQIPELINRAQQAVKYYPHYRYNEGISLLYYLRGIDSRTPTKETHKDFQYALKAAQAAVSSAPARPMIWSRIALLHALLGHPPEKILSAFNMSIFSGRVEPTLYRERIALAMRYLEWMDDETRALLKDQVLLSWATQPQQITTALKQEQIKLQGLKDLFAGTNQTVLEEMEASLGPVQ